MLLEYDLIFGTPGGVDDTQKNQIRTAGVFDGHQNSYTDFDQPVPLSYYAKAKYHGELFVQRFMERHYIFRAGWMMGGGPGKDKKFINKIYKQIKAGATELYVVEDKLGIRIREGFRFQIPSFNMLSNL